MPLFHRHRFVLGICVGLLSATAATNTFGMLLGARERGGARAVSAGLNSFDMAAGRMRGTQYVSILASAGQRGLWDLGPDGLLYLVPRYDAHLVRVHGSDGAVLREIAREHDPRLRIEQEKEQQREVVVTVPDGDPGDRLILLDEGRFILIKGLESMAIMVAASSSGTTSSMTSGQNSRDVVLELICYEVMP